VLLVQFLKGQPTGELGPLERLGVDIVRADNITKFIPYMTPQELEACRSAQHGCLAAARECAGRYDLMILDEAIGAASTGMIGLEELAAFVSGRPEGLELVLTGRDAPPALIELADYVSDIKAVRHPYDRGITARRGIEY
jgi:cob(I)alamin adenosyltransferase